MNTAPGVRYFSIADAPHQFFRCEPFRATLSTKACADRYRQAQTATGDAAERFEKCRSCPIGAAHAGAQYVHRSPIFGMSICPRSRRWASRLIHGRLGVGAYNREREFVLRCDAKGHVPLYRLDPRRVAVVVDGARIELRDELTRDTVEMAVAVLRTIPGRIVFTRPRACAPAITTVELARRHRPRPPDAPRHMKCEAAARRRRRQLVAAMAAE